MRSPNTYSKKELRNEIASSLANLQLLQALLGEKKCNKRIKKAVRLLTSNLPKKSKAPKTTPAKQPSTLPLLPETVLP